MFLSEPEWQAVLLSLKVSSLAVVLSLPFGIFFSWLLVRRSFPGKAEQLFSIAAENSIEKYNKLAALVDFYAPKGE